MAILEKLLIRWHLTSIQIVVAVPFVGHTYLSKPDKMGIWTWLLSLVAPEVGVFVTRSATFANYNKVLEDMDGLNHAFLDEYGLANKLIAANVRQQDFHAKFFIGFGWRGCEVLSGSANIVKGPSIENISFRSVTIERCKERYIDPLKLKLPEPQSTIPHVLVTSEGGTYQPRRSSSYPLAT